jgi:hypothetical protein
VLPLLLTTALLAQTYVVPPAGPLLDPLKLCYVTVKTGPKTYEAESMMIGGSGFTPGAVIDVTIDGELAASGVPAGADGSLPDATLPSPSIRSGERSFRVTATERDDRSRTATARSRVSELAVRVEPKRAFPAQKVRFYGRGFTDQGGIYAHYVRKGTLRRTVRLAPAASGACGRFSVKAPQFPFRPRTGVWRLQIDQHRRLTEDGPLINLIIDVRRRTQTSK